MEVKQIDKRARLSSTTPSSSWLCQYLEHTILADSIVGNVDTDIPNIKLSTDGQSDFEVQIGSGEPVITI